MCQFFSCISNGKGKIWYFDADIRQQIRDGKLNYAEDSHASIAKFYKSEIQEDKANKYEYDPLTGKFTIDMLNATDEQGFELDDSERVKALVTSLDFNTVVPNWGYVQDLLARLKKYKSINPIKATRIPDPEIIKPLLSQSRDQVRDKSWDQVRAQVGAEFGAQVWDQIRDQVWARAWHQVSDQVGAQVRDQVWAQVGLCAYFSVKLFMNLPYEHPAFDLIRLGIIVVNVSGKCKVFGKKGKFLGEFDYDPGR